MNNYEEADEIEFIDHDMEFSSILDIPLYARIRSSLHAFFAKIHATISIPQMIGSVYIVILSIQSLFPSFLIDCEDIWPKDNFLTPVFQIFGYFWVGPSTNKNYTRVLISYIFAIIFLVSFLILVIRAIIYKKHIKIYTAEIWTVYLVFKFVFPLVCPHIFHPIPLVIENFVNSEHLAVSVLDFIFSPAATVIYMILVYTVIFPRVLFENLPTHEWLPILPLACILNTTTQATFSVCASVITSKARIIFPILMCIESLVCGLIVYLFSSVLKRTVCVAVGSMSFTSSAISLIQGINLILPKHINPEIVFILFIVFLILFFILLRLLNTKIIINAMSFFDSCEESPQLANEMLSEKMKTPQIFIAYIRFTLCQCHPYVSSMEPFNFALHKWPNHTNLILFYGRILAIFPWRNNQMALIASLLSKQSGSKSYTSYLLQFRHISRTRQTLLTNRIKKQIEEIRSQCETLKRIIKRFWENILQKNTNAFWDDVRKVKRRIKGIENILQKMCEDYPNNEAVILEQIKFVSTIKKDYIEENAIRERLEKLRTEGFIKADTSFSIASKVFPVFCSQAEVYESPENSNEKIEIEENNRVLNSNEISENDATSISDRNRRICVQQSIDRSPLGRVWPIIIYLTVATCLSIAIYLVFHFTYVQKFLDKELNAIQFLQILNKAIYEINSMCFYLTVFPSVFPGYSSSLPPNFMELIAPTLYPNYIPYFNLTTDFISVHSTAAGKYMSDISNTMIKLDNDNEYVIAINKMMTQIELENGLTVKATINQMLIDSKSVILHTDPISYYESDEYKRLGDNYILLFSAFTNMSVIATAYASLISDRSNNLLNNLMILTITVNLAFVSLPFILYLFRLQLQSESISVSFSYLPNTEIRSIINKYGSSTTKNDEDMNSISRLTQSIPLHSNENIKKVIVFCFTFLPIFVCALVTYYYSFVFKDQTQNIAMKIFTLYPAFAEMTSGVGFLIRVAQIDSDPVNFLPSREDRDAILTQSSLLLYLAMTSFSDGMWSEIAGADAYFNPRFKDDVKIDKFEYVFGQNNGPNSNPKSFTYFEQFAIEGLLRSIDVIFGYSLSYLTEHMYKDVNPCSFTDNFVLSVFYWFGSFSFANRTRIYFDLVEKDVDMKIYEFKNNEVSIMSVCTSAQAFALFLVILYLLQLHSNIRDSLQFYQYINPQVLLENQNIVLLIEDEKRTIERANSSYFNLEYTVEMDPKGIVIIDSNLNILKNNPAFRRIILPQQQQQQQRQAENQNENDENQQQNNGQASTNLNNYLNPVKNEINNVFENFVYQIAEELKGQSLTELIQNIDSSNESQNILNTNMIDNIKNEQKDDDNNKKVEENEILEGSWTDFIFHLNECVSGKFKPQFTMNVSGKTIDNRPVHLTCNVIAMNAEGAVEEGDVSQIEKLAIIFEDCTQFFVRKQMIAQEQSLAQDLLLQVLPPRLAHSFMDAGYEGFSFVVQTATIGFLDVHFDTEASDKVSVSKEKLQLASDLLKVFDEEISEFDLLCKVRSFGTSYVYAGGLISDMNKPERHADQATRFALKMIALVEDLAKKTNYDMKLTVGIHTGGPVVAGVIENQKPTFQIIGSVMEVASQMTMTDVPNLVQVTRAVYELIFTSGFHIIERGDTEIKGGQTVTTYLINPK